MFYHKKTLKGILLILVTIIALAFSQKKYSRSTDKIIYGKFIISIYLNDALSRSFPQSNMYVYDNYCLEESKTVLQHALQTVNADGKLQTNTTTVRDSLTGYILTNIKDRISYQFNPSKLNPKLESSFPVNKKTTGFNFKDENIESTERSNFVYIKDTIINKRSFKQVKSVSDLATGSSAIKKLTTVYIDKNLKGFPIHPISKFLDVKFEGLSTIIEVITGDQSVKMNFSYTDGLNQEELRQIKKYINLSTAKNDH